MKKIIFLLIIASLLSFGNSVPGIISTEKNISINDTGCQGTYSGPEFINGSDVAHQFSNKMSRVVGDQLKVMYNRKKYVKVDLKKIVMTTKNMNNKGDVIYHLNIPFIPVKKACDATTSFDHRGGWGHKIKKESVLKIFGKKKGLEFIELNTNEGLQEFWIQWRNSNKQSHCN